ncbi:hypothetical protein D3C78_1883590 [compost metagenome]
MDQGAWKLGRKRAALGLLAWRGGDRRGIQRLEFDLDSRDIGIEQLVEQADLIGTEMLAALS